MGNSVLSSLADFTMDLATPARAQSELGERELMESASHYALGFTAPGIPASITSNGAIPIIRGCSFAYMASCKTVGILMYSRRLCRILIVWCAPIFRVAAGAIG